MVSGLSLLFEIISLGLDVICDAGFDGRFGPAVGVCGADWADLGNGYHIFEAGGIAVDSGRRGKDDIGDIVACHRGQKTDGAVDIGAVVL